MDGNSYYFTATKIPSVEASEISNKVSAAGCPAHYLGNAVLKETTDEKMRK